MNPIGVTKDETMRNQSKARETRRNRPISFTDQEWSDIGIAASKLRIPKTRYVSSRALQDYEARPHTPDELQLVMAHKAALQTLYELSGILVQSTDAIDMIVAMDRLEKIESRLNLIVSLSIGDGETRYRGKP